MRSSRMADGFADRLRAHRRVNNLSQQKLADLAGCDQWQIAQYEREKCCPSYGILKRLCEVLDIQSTDLLGF